MPKLQNLRADQFVPILEDLGLSADDLVLVDPAPTPASEVRKPPPLGTGPLLVGQIGGGLDAASACPRYRERADASLPADAPALFFLKDLREDEELARWRNALWPWLHVVRIYRISGGTAERETLQGRQGLEGTCGIDGVLLVGFRRAHVLSPDATVEKFDANASGWNGEPGRPGYAHFRWMRKYVALLGEARPGERILDFGCGAGWVGIEAALAARAKSGATTTLRAFDPSPEMVRIATENARANGIGDFEGRPGFGEQPPYPEQGEEPFDLVLSSGVVSFSPDTDAWLEGLGATLKPGGRLVIGDIHGDARGMQRRKLTKPLLPAREMNAQTGSAMKTALESRGFTVQSVAGYQLTWPIPQAMHYSDTRLGGLLTAPLLALNKLRAGGASLDSFDSWVITARAPA